MLILLVNVMMSKDTNNISLVLEFFSRMVDKHGVKNKKIHEIKTKFGEKRMFYLVKCEVFEDLTLLEYIDSQNVRLSRQREELIDLSVKIANQNNNNNMRHSQQEVINHFKSGLPGGVGLRDMITQIKERYPWSSSKKIIMIFVSLMTCLLGVGLYVLDLWTDVKFSLSMLDGTAKYSDERNVSVKEDLNFAPVNMTHVEFFYPDCYEYMKNESQSQGKNYTKVHNFLDEEDYGVTGWIAIYHCIQPVLLSLVIFLSINYKKCQIRKNCLTPNIPVPERWNYKDWLIFNNIFCCMPNLIYLPYKTILAIGRVVPNPAFTNIYGFYLTVKRHNARSQPDFRTKIASTEEKIRKHEPLGKI